MSKLALIGRESHARVIIVKALPVLLLVLFSFPAFAEDWTTTDGTVYQNVRVVKVEDDAVTILYKEGGALVPLLKLPPQLQKKFDYDPVKAKIAADARVIADAENAKLLQAEIEEADRLKKQAAIDAANNMHQGSKGPD